MKNTSITTNIIIVNLGLVLLATIIYLLTSARYSGEEFAFAAGIVALLLGIVNLFIGIILVFTRYNAWRNGFMLTGAVLLLLSGITCGAGLGLS